MREYNNNTQFLGYARLYGSEPGGQAEYLGVSHADYGPIKVPQIGEDERYLYLSDVLPTAWQAVQYAAPPQGGSLAVLGLGPVGQMSARIGRHLGYEVFAVDRFQGVGPWPNAMASTRWTPRRGGRAGEGSHRRPWPECCGRCGRDRSPQFPHRVGDPPGGGCAAVPAGA